MSNMISSTAAQPNCSRHCDHRNVFSQLFLPLAQFMYDMLTSKFTKLESHVQWNIRQPPPFIEWADI